MITEGARQLARDRIQAGAARQARHQYLTDLAARHHVELPAMPVGDEAAVTDACAVLEDAGAEIDWSRIDIPDPNRPTEKRSFR